MLIFNKPTTIARYFNKDLRTIKKYIKDGYITQQELIKQYRVGAKEKKLIVYIVPKDIEKLRIKR